MDKLTLTVDETAVLLRISRGMAYNAVNKGTIPSIRIGKRLLVPVTKKKRLLEGYKRIEE